MNDRAMYNWCKTATWLALLVLVAFSPGRSLLAAEAPSDLIFADDFESGDVSSWTNAIRESCDYPHCWLDPMTPCPPVPPCSFSDKTCFMGEMILSPPQDICIDTPAVTPFPLAEFADCTAAGIPQSLACGPGSRCLQVAPGDVQCRDFCAVSEGALGTDNHPDCRRPEAVCTDIGHPDFGLCE